jgi:hypothetical protein
MKKITALVLATSWVAGSAFGATPSSSAATSTSSAAPKLIDKLTVSYLNVFYGASITDPAASTQPNTDTGEARGGSPIFMKNYVSVGYKINDRVTLAPVLYWTYQPVRGNDLTLKDSYLKLGHSKVLSIGNFSMAADVRLAAPTSTVSRDVGRIGYLMSKQVSSFEIPKSRFTLGLTTYGMVHAYSKAAGKQMTEFYAGPSVDYTITPTLRAGLLYEAAAAHTYGQGATAMNNLGTDLEPNVSWDITPNINLNPYIDLKTSQGIKAETTSIGAVFSWKLL